MAVTERRRPGSRRLLLGLCLVSAGAAQADDRAAAGVFVYNSSDDLTVVHPTATVRAAVDEKTEARVSYDADVISAATIDVRTAASPRGFDEARHGIALGLDHAVTRLTRADMAARYSHSPDYLSGSLGFGFTTQDAGRNRTFGLAVSGAFDSVGRAGDARRLGHVSSVGCTLSGDSVLSEWALVDLASSIEYRRGYLESPYRFIPIREPDSEPPWAMVPESVPDDQLRAATRARYRVAFTRALFGRATVGVHLDDWGVLGGTGELETSLQLGKVLLSVGGHTSMQRAASFYRGRYQTAPLVPRLRTADRKLARSLKAAGTGRLEYELGSWSGMLWSSNVNGELGWHRYFDTPGLPRETTLMLGLAIEARR